jgi:hypothetical protein
MEASSFSNQNNIQTKNSCSTANRIYPNAENSGPEVAEYVAAVISMVVRGYFVPLETFTVG